VIKRKRLRFNLCDQEEADNDEVQNISMVRDMQKDLFSLYKYKFFRKS